jgi:hypothetical protein
MSGLVLPHTIVMTRRPDTGKMTRRPDTGKRSEDKTSSVI